MPDIPEIKFKKVEVDGVELDFPTEEILALEKIVSIENLFGQQNLKDVLTYIQENASITNFLATSDIEVENNVGSWVDVPDLSLTPDVAGTYIVMCFILCSHSLNNGLGDFALAKNGTRETSTITNFSFATKNNTYVVPFVKIVSVNGTTDTIAAQWDDVSGRLTATNRYLFMLRTV
jgi:hypothetical protein